MLCLMHCPCNTCARCIALAHKPGQSQSLAHVCPIFHHIGLLHCPAILAAPQHSTRRSSGARGPTARQRHSLRPRCLSRCQLQYSKLAMARHKSSRTPLRDRALAALATCMPRLNPHPRSVWVEGRSLPIRLRVYNQLPADVVQVFWIGYEGEREHYADIPPAGGMEALSSFSTHPWCFVSEGGKHAVHYVGGSAVLTMLPGGKLRVDEMPPDDDEDDESWWRPEWGRYRQRGAAPLPCGRAMPIEAFDCVPDAAVSAAVVCLTHMLAGCQHDILHRMADAGCKLAIIGRDQGTCDIPAHRFMRHHRDEGGRDINATTRGLGATLEVPTASCGEENCTMVDDTHYWQESVLVHEMAHAVMALGFDDSQTATINQLYEHAKERQLYDADCYMLQDADEYWAEATQSWFDATTRRDVNSGINTREALQQHNPGVAALLRQVFGARNSWRYSDTCPGRLGAVEDAEMPPGAPQTPA